MATQTPDLCQICEDLATKGCTTCEAVRYCSAECQAQDKDFHNILCPVFSDSKNMPARPSKDHYKAVLFPADKPMPRLVWLYGNEKTDEKGARNRYIKSAPFVGADQSAFMAWYPTEGSSYLHCKLPSFDDDKSTLNVCLEQIVWITTGKKSIWKGPVLGYSVLSDGSPNGPLRDVEFNDCRYMLICTTPDREDIVGENGQNEPSETV